MANTTSTAVKKFLTKKLLSTVTIIGAFMAVINWAPELGNLLFGNPIRYYTKPAFKKHQSQLDSIKFAMQEMKRDYDIKMMQREASARKFTEILCTIIKGELTPYKLEDSKNVIYQTNSYYDSNGDYHSGDFYFFDHKDDHLNCFPYQAIYNSTLRSWGYIDQVGQYHKIE